MPGPFVTSSAKSVADWRTVNSPTKVRFLLL